MATATETRATGRDLLQGTTMPEMTPLGIAKHFGPGLILMMTGVGTSHLVTAPVAGGRFQFALLWVVLLAYVIKYSGFEMAFRFTNATGRGIMDAYATAPGKWPVWYVLVATIVQCAVGQAGRLIAASAVLYYVFSSYMGLPIPMGVYAFVLAVSSVVMLLYGRYAVLEAISKAMAAVLFFTSLVVFVVEPPPASALAHFAIFDTPEGSWLMIAALIGLLPTGIDVSLQASEWGKAKKKGMGLIRGRLEAAGLAPKFDPFHPRREDLTVHSDTLPPDVREYCRRWFVIGEWDFAFGHFVSFVVAAIFLMLAAVALYPSEVAGNAVIGEIAGMFTRSLGPWMMVVFIICAFAALYSTVLNYFDGWPRVVAACARNLFRPTAALPGIAASDVTPEGRSRWYSEFNIYRITMIYSLVTAVVLVAGVPRPVFLVLVSSALAFFIAPVIYFLNLYYCLTVIPKDDPLFYPSAATRWFGWISLVAFTVAAVIIFMVEGV